MTMESRPLNWRTRVIEAEARGEFTAEDRSLARGWSTCAVGEQHYLYPEVVLMAAGPLDEMLAELGNIDGFYGAVQENNLLRAHDLLDAIEARVLQLKREAGGQP